MDFPYLRKHMMPCIEIHQLKLQFGNDKSALNYDQKKIPRGHSDIL